MQNACRTRHPRLARVHITQKSIQLKDAAAKALAQITHNKMQPSVCEIFIASARANLINGAAAEPNLAAAKRESDNNNVRGGALSQTPCSSLI
jgi:hypothetical protein